MKRERNIDTKIDELARMVAQGFTDMRKETRDGLAVMNERVDGIDARIGDVQRKLTKVGNKIEDIQDDLTSALSASGNDGSAILNHEHRISHLEKLGGIKSIPAKHLADLK